MQLPEMISRERKIHRISKEETAIPFNAESRSDTAYPLRLLLLEDNEMDALLLMAQLQRDGFNAISRRVDSKPQFLEELQAETPTLILADHEMPQFTAIDALNIINERKLDIPFIIVSGVISEELAVSVLQQGAADCLHKERLTRLGTAISRALEQKRLRDERQHAIQALKQSEAQVRILLQSTAEAIFGLDLNGCCTFCNPATLRLFGYHSNEELLGRDMHDLVHHSHADGSVYPRSQCPIIQSLGKKNETHLEAELFWRKDGTSFFAECWSHPVRRDGSIIGCVVSIIDITERKSAIDALRASEKHYRLLFESSPTPVLVYDEQTHAILAVNAAMQNNYGYTKEELLKMRLPDLHFEEDSGDFYDFLNHLKEKQAPSCTARHKCRDGSAILTELTSHPLEFNGKNAQLLQAVDITERRRAEERIREQASLLDLAHDAIFVRDLDHKILFWSKGAEQIYGWPAEEALGRDCKHLLYSDFGAFDTAQLELLKTGEWNGEIHQKSREDRKIIADSRWTLLRDDNGSPKSVLVINTDVTEQKELENQFLRAQRLESIGTLASGVAHDLNNVLVPIMMSASMLREPLSPQTQEEFITTIEQSAQRGAHLLRQVLTFARGVEGQHVPLKPESIISEVLEMARQTFPKTIKLRCDLADALWQVSGDATKLHQVLLNFVVNARDAMEGGGILKISAWNVEVDGATASMNANAKLGRYVAIAVQDSGTGMPEELIRKIFDPFFTTKGPGKGTGLGLSTALGIVKSYGGFIEVASELGSGTTFTAFLPAITQASPVLDQKASAPHYGRGELILMVDDEAGIRTLAKAILSHHGYRVVSAKDGTDALAEYIRQGGAVKLVLTDLVMPTMDGVVLARALRRMDPKAKILPSSGVESIPRLGEFKALGINDFLAKPYNATQLLNAVGTALNANVV